MKYVNTRELEENVKRERERKDLEAETVLSKINEKQNAEQRRLVNLLNRAAEEERKESEAKAKKEIETETARLQTEVENKIKSKYHLISDKESDDDLRQIVRELSAKSDNVGGVN